MTIDSQKLIDTVETGELTDSGAMTTTADVAQVVSDSRETVEQKLEALEDEGLIESKMFGNERVWVVPDNNGNDDDDSPDETPMPTDTRVPPVK
jgi:DNA-binding transcriptional MocR family regulator